MAERQKAWGTLDEAIEQLQLESESVKKLLIPLPYHPQPSPGRIRFRVMGAPKRLTKLWWEDVLAFKSMQNRPE